MATTTKVADQIELYHRLCRYRPKGWRDEAISLKLVLTRAGVPVPPVPDETPVPLRPLGDHVLIEPDEAKTTTEGGLVIPDSAKEVPEQGIVLAVGPGRTEPGVGTIVPAVTAGDHVLFGKYAGLRVTLGGRALLIVREEDILGILTEAT